MDKVWKRIEEDNVLIEFQLVRIKQILEDLFLRPGQIKASDVMFLEQLVRRVSSNHESSLTVLALEQIIAAITSNGHPAVQKDPFQPRRPYQPPRSKPIRQILPDYYIGSGAYSVSNVNDMLALSSGLDRVGFSVRAGVAANSVEQVARLVDRPGRFLVVSAESTDKEGRRAVGPLLEKVGEDKLILELGPGTDPPATSSSGGNPRIPQPKQPRDNSGSNSQSPNLPTILSLFFICRLFKVPINYILNI